MSPLAFSLSCHYYKQEKSMNSILKLLPFAGLVLSALGIYEAFKISHVHFTTIESCPILAILPACYVVLVSYTLMTLGWMGVLTSKISFLSRYKNWIFWVGFTPAFLLALAGTMGEIFGFVDCPETASHIPKCFISLGFVLMIAMGWIVYRRVHFVKYQFDL